MFLDEEEQREKDGEKDSKTGINKYEQFLCYIVHM